VELAWIVRPRDDTWDLIKVLFVAGFFVVLFWQARRRNRDRTLELADLAARWGGRVLPGGVFAHPRLEIRVEDEPAEVTFHAADRNKSKWTLIRVNWPCPTRLRVTPEGFTNWMKSVFGGGDIKVGDAAFDKKFWVVAEDEEWARGVLTPEIQRRLMGFRDDFSVISRKVITLDLGPSGLALKTLEPLLDDPGLLETFLEMTSLILRVAQGKTPVAGIDVGAIEVRGGSVCPVCGHGVEGGHPCPRCRTPHHEDCWTYMGGCAIFGCSSRVRTGEEA
jgi:hypothetical protein